ncbi:YbcC family protein [Aquimarina muelleri]|uniref:Probable inorganic carbon transporter subunit DabA n=1 Tax=Aquimarina muelleri TaxID=279356 RepID=A0A918N2L9_9FLAO|nr:DUF2309 domain-containing protein [Aquimarina muelleri]MCX2761435.1 DUF2309 domain-containing protein [Aquimarina muelleri]GGX13678.1 hypothetical protein GCM10007384_14080 [Aquimarina muelleri]
MKQQSIDFDEQLVLHRLKHYLPAQAPLKDFVHHNTLHAFQELSFFEALQKANATFGYKTALSLNEYRKLYKDGIINTEILKNTIHKYKDENTFVYWRSLVFDQSLSNTTHPEIGKLRPLWKNHFKIDLNMLVHPKLFKLIGAYLDQGVSEKRFPYPDKTLLDAVRALQQNSMVSVFRSNKVITFLNDPKTTITSLLAYIVGDVAFYEQYLFDQQFAHPGWSGMVTTIEVQLHTLLDQRKVTLHDFIFLELLLEIEALDQSIGLNKLPLSGEIKLDNPASLFKDIKVDPYWKVITIWQEALEWSYHSQVLQGLVVSKTETKSTTPSFQAFFCIDDREESIRRHLEQSAPGCETFGTPGHFGMAAMYQPESGKFYTQVCPGSLSPKHLIKEEGRTTKNGKDIHFHKGSHRLFTGWLLSQTIGFWSAIKLFFNLFKPQVSPAHSSAFEHMEHASTLIIENKNNNEENGYKVGYSIEEMTEIVYGLLKSTGLTTNFASLIYLIGHGGSSTNNPYYAGYNCGACSGRAGSVNSRAVAEMANRKDVRAALKNKNIQIPETSYFIGGLHDTTRDEIKFYDVESLSPKHKEAHALYISKFEKALSYNAKERARQFLLINIKRDAVKVHKDVKNRSTALFEPRPELNHSNNTLCIVGRRSLTKNVFLDQRAFLNSYDYEQDVYGVQLKGILQAATPVCGGINLEYYFSRVDNEKLGAGSKLPHNVIGLFGVANGIKGDLRPGLPSQMIDVHAPLRLMMIVEHYPEIVLQIIKKDPKLSEWYYKEWVKLAIIHPKTKTVYYLFKGELKKMETTVHSIESVTDLESIFENHSSNLPVYQLNTL